MSLFEASTINVVAWLLALAFIAAGMGNTAGCAAIQVRLQRWGYPAWWNSRSRVGKFLWRSSASKSHFSHRISSIRKRRVRRPFASTSDKTGSVE